MNFLEALKLAKEGKCIRDIEWYHSDYIYINDKNFVNELHSPYTPSIMEMLDEWEIYEKRPKTYTFIQAIEALKEGKMIRRYGHDRELSNKIKNNAEIFSYDDLEARDWLIYSIE